MISFKTLITKRRTVFFVWLITFLLLSSLSSTMPAAATTEIDFLQQITRKEYPHAHVVLARENESISYSHSGESRSEDEIFLTILDDQGKREQAVQSFHVNRSYSRLDISLVEIIKAGGKRVVIDIAANSKEDTSGRNTRMNIYNPNQKVIRVYIPGLEIGDTIHYQTVRERFKPTIPNHTYGMVLGQYFFPVHSYHFTLTGPADMPMHHLIKDKIDGCVFYEETTGKGLISRKWIFSQVPPVVPEPSMPPISQVAMRLLFSSLDSWEAISRWYFELVEPKLQPTAEMVAMVKELTANLTTPEDKMAAIFYFVAQQIRYMGITEESNRPGFEPHQVGLTFSRRHGVCRDKAALLVSMLRLAGIQADPVLISVDEKLDQEIPLPYFNHAITMVNDNHGRPLLFMDPTSETSRQFFPDYERDASYLIADSQGSILQITPSAAPEANRFSLIINDQLNPDNSLSGKITASCRGFADTVMRSLLMRRSREEQKDFLEQMILRRRSGIRVDNFSWSDPADRTTLFTFSCTFSLPNAIRWIGEQKGVFLPFSNMDNPGILDRWILKKADMTSRKYPLRLGYTYKTVVEEHLSGMKPLKKIRLPARATMDSNLFTYRTTYTLAGPDQLTIKNVFSVKKLEIPSADYHQLTLLQHNRESEVLLPIVIDKLVK
jgi:hypothetical protein